MINLAMSLMSYGLAQSLHIMQTMVGITGTSRLAAQGPRPDSIAERIAASIPAREAPSAPVLAGSRLVPPRVSAQPSGAGAVEPPGWGPMP